MSEAGPVEKFMKWLTMGRFVAFLIALIFGGIGTLVGFLIGEGAAREAFDGRLVDHDKRITSLEIKAEKAAETAAQILGKLSALEGKLDGIGEMLRAKVQP